MGNKQKENFNQHYSDGPAKDEYFTTENFPMLGEESGQTKDVIKTKVSSLKRAMPQILAITVKNILLFEWGLSFGMSTILIPSLQGKGDPNETILLDEYAISWIGSLNYLCVPVGCLFSGAITGAFGRKRAMQMINIPFFAAWLIYHYATEGWHLFLALTLIGISGGLLEAPVMTYAAEITEPRLRGALTSTTTLCGNLGSFVSFFYGSFVTWRTAALMNAVVPVVAIIALQFVPESPYWLLSKNRVEDARKSLAWLRGWTTVDNVEKEFLELKDHLETEPFNHKLTWDTLKLYTKPNFVKPFLLISFAFVLGHFGCTPLATYSIQTFTLMQVPISSYHATVYLGLVQLIASVVSTFGVKYLGKRILSFISLTGEIIFLGMTAAYVFAIGANYFDQPISSQEIAEKYSYIPLLGMIGQSFFAHLMMKGLSWILIGELFSNDVRAFACGFCSATAYVIGFVANKIFLDLVRLLTLGGELLLFVAIAVLGIILLHFCMPETEGKTLMEITGHYAGKNKLGNKVYKKPKKNIDSEKDIF